MRALVLAVCLPLLLAGCAAMTTMTAEAWRDLELRVHASAHGDLRLLRNGTVVQLAHGAELACCAPPPGTYRAEVLAGGEPWLFSSSIRVVEVP
ncbi:MAG TPA: hypothetical protein VFD82_15195 [Planctomycetota bacterium]|nr:hypothetical protein [Planctomycetota bacterium]